MSVRDHVVSTDQPSRAGGDDSAPTPLELLSASLASCIALYVHKFCETNSLVTSGFAIMNGYITNIERDTLANEHFRVIPAGVEYNIVNISKDRALRLYTLYSPPEHADGTVHHTKEDDTLAERH